MTVAVVVGNPKAGSRTRRVAMAAADTLADLPGAGTDRLVLDLAEVAAELFDPESARVHAWLTAVAASDLLIVASPTYKASYTGLLKSFFDRYDNNALAGAVAVAVMTGASPVHALAPEVHLRPLLVELGASIPARGLYVIESQFEDLDPVIEAWAEATRPQIARALAA